VRVEGFAFAHVADEGIIDSCAAELLRYRKQIGADKIQIWADVKKKHSSHAITADISLGETAQAAEFMRADALIVTGPVTGKPPKPNDVNEAKAHSSLPVFLGSGMDAGNIREFLLAADGFIVGSAFQKRSELDEAGGCRAGEGVFESGSTQARMTASGFCVAGARNLFRFKSLYPGGGIMVASPLQAFGR